MIQNRLEKNWKKLDPWARQNKIEAFRLYDHDIPEFPFFIDKYLKYFVIYDRTDTRDAGKDQLLQVVEALKTLFNAADEDLIIKKRQRQKGETQYDRLDETEKFFWVQETQARLKINLWDYLDTGIFLDHRPMRQKLFKMAAGKRLLNLFCYTGSISVFAALGGARTTSVDMSATYVDWMIENFKENSIPLNEHEFIQDNALDYIEKKSNPKFDLIFLDPPTFSNSKRMIGTFEVERDQDLLVENCMRHLTPGGVLFFSNNKQRFKISEHLKEMFSIKDITSATIPKDFHDQKVHQVFEITSRL